MFNNGNNGGGNPNHASDGKFTSGPNQAGNGETVRIGKYKFTPENLESDKLYNYFNYYVKKALDESLDEQAKKQSKPFDINWGEPDSDVVKPKNNGGN